jgi:hypothetical protein
MPSRRLPRGPQAERPRADEVVRKRTSADLQNGWLGRHGTLLLTDDRLVFVPTPLDTALRAKRREIPLAEIEEIERFPREAAAASGGGRRPRMLLHTRETTYELMVGDLDAWIDALEIVYEMRRERGLPHTPRVTREGYVNMLRPGR